MFFMRTYLFQRSQELVILTGRARFLIDCPLGFEVLRNYMRGKFLEESPGRGTSGALVPLPVKLSGKNTLHSGKKLLDAITMIVRTTAQRAAGDIACLC